MESPAAVTPKARQTRLTRSLVLAGALSSLYYIGLNIFIPTQYPGYDWMSQTVSELSAVDTPTRPLWVWLCVPYNLMMIAFAVGVWQAGGGTKTLRCAGGVILSGSLVGLFWPPMHQREVLAAGGGTLTDTLHIVFTMIWGMASLATMVLAAVSLRSRVFTLWTVTMALVTIGFGMITGTDSPKMEQDLPTPLMGLYERIGMSAFMIWVVVFSTVLMRRDLNDSRKPRR